MVNCTGKSLIPISFDVYQKFMNSVVPPNKLPEFNIKLDARSNAKASFAKLKGVDLTIYTGTIINLGAQKLPNISDALSLVILFTIYGVKKAGTGGEFELKTNDAGVAELKCDPDFQALSGQLHFFMEKFAPLNTQAISASVMSSVSSDGKTVVAESKSATEPKPAKTPASPYKGQPLGETPKIQVPADLDLRTV